MGPLLFRAEDGGDGEREGFEFKQLQWGRSCSERKTRQRPGHAGGSPPGKLQWGRSCSERKTRLPRPFLLVTVRTGFNGAALVQSGRRAHRCDRVHGENASMGPLLFRAEDGAAACYGPQAGIASMGPLLFRAEDPVQMPTGTTHPSRFNGAALVQSGRPPGIDPWKPQHKRRFNGAALVQSGRRRDLEVQRRTADASMGPLLFRAEDVVLAANANQRTVASMGPLLFRAEDVVEVAAGGFFRVGFNGAALVQSGRPDPGSTEEIPKGASMGPLLFRAEDSRDHHLLLPPSAASMGPLLFRAEDPCGSSPATIAADRFNGAALVQSGRPEPDRSVVHHRTGFNGAALVQSGRLGKLDKRPGCGCASMGPLLFRAEDGPPQTAVNVGVAGFNGAALVQSGRRAAFRSAATGGSVWLQWGRSCSERKTRVTMQITGSV